MKTRSFHDGLVIHGDFMDPAVQETIAEALGSQRFALTIADPPYGNILRAEWDRIAITDNLFVDWMLEWTRLIADVSLDRSALYLWGGIGKPGFRPFYKYLTRVESETKYQLANQVTWSKRRAYGLAYNFLFCREELAYLTLGDIKKPRCFHIPLLDQKRGYAGFNKDYPAKSEYLRRTNVWHDVTEIFKGKIHEAQKPLRLMEIPIEIHTEPGELVLDPFAGSGTTAIAARKLGRRFVVVEQDERWFKYICKALEENWKAK